MKINENVSQTTEQKRRKSEERLKSLVIVILAVVAIGAGYYAYDQYHKKEVLAEQLGIESKNSERVIATFEQIEENLAEIRSREGVIARNLSPEQLADASHEDRIFNEIAAIEALTAENNRMIDELNKTLDDKNTQLAWYKKSSADLNRRVTEYKTRTNILMAEAEALRDSLTTSGKRTESMRIALDYKENEVLDKSRMIEEQAQALAEKEAAIRTAYYKVGPYKTLKDQHVIYKEGGIIGLAAVKSVRPDVDKEQFNKIDIYEKTMIPVNSKDPEIVTVHDINSYDLIKGEDGTVQWLKVTNPDKFWRANKYLVIVTKAGEGSTEVASAL